MHALTKTLDSGTALRRWWISPKIVSPDLEQRDHFLCCNLFYRHIVGSTRMPSALTNEMNDEHVYANLQHPPSSGCRSCMGVHSGAMFLLSLLDFSSTKPWLHSWRFSHCRSLNLWSPAETPLPTCELPDNTLSTTPDSTRLFIATTSDSRIWATRTIRI